MKLPVIRPIEKRDNAQLQYLIRSILEDFGVPKIGSAYADAALDDMYGYYLKEKAAYFVIDHGERIIGGAGIAQLDNYNGPICELQKMYFLTEARGRGLGTRMMELCLQKATEFGFEKVYLETMPYMIAAQKLYERSGFEYIDGPIGDTGHYACQTHMMKTL
ncbi:MAG: GNAT family N-acetyltransferase [Bacteroidia bacterium]|nr:GNAT family N-acetyltransferase [Bacteroidia bacterium]NNF30266.1 GNAT family N-acetyltransferase [Flavobacteriaceae bacterium]MBT8277337.1 GNAT family N-acetyltransferase [Bacteroidia bacterium]NNJ81581.1 GNAT family N-acetyltransferase [Flavobacteriaceae bacterium]NNK54273.1 GNAT family N-acetyltransferase [Flavobacteriaceae bacterium]